MHGWRPDVDLEFLKGKTLIQVCFGPLELELRFAEDGTSVSFQSTVEFEFEGTGGQRLTIGRGQRRDSVLENAFPILSLLMHVVTDVRWVMEGMTTLTFDDGRTVKICETRREQKYRDLVRTAISQGE